MPSPKERILLVENDPEICDLIARQTLLPMGYKVMVAGAVAQAIQEMVKFAPDVILADLDLPGLSGKDLLFALSSQGVEAPVIVIAPKGMEGDVIQAFRLGASDYLNLPIREAEVVVVVERVLKQLRSRREREALAQQLSQANQELQQRVRQLTAIFAFGKEVTPVAYSKQLSEKILDAAVYLTAADSGWLLMKEGRGNRFILRACKNVPRSIAEKQNQAWEDGISSLVALSGEPLSMYGEALKRFKVVQLGQSVLVAPVKFRREVAGLVVVVRKAAAPFGANNQNLLESLCDYASIALFNAKIIQELEEQVRSLQAPAESAQASLLAQKLELQQNIYRELYNPMDAALSQVKALLAGKKGVLSEEQKAALRISEESLANLLKNIAARSPSA
ncbi:MAG: response regulator [Omnitrophica WOR_2 bacterium]